MEVTITHVYGTVTPSLASHSHSCQSHKWHEASSVR